MAETPVVNPDQRFFEAFRKLVERIHREEGPLYFAMLAEFEEDGRWVFLLGSERLSRDVFQGTQKAAKYVAALPREFRTQIARVGIVGKTDPFYRAVSKAVSSEPVSLVRIENSTFDGLPVRKAALFASAA